MKLRKRCTATNPGLSGLCVSDQPYWGKQCARIIWFGRFHTVHWTEKLSNGISYSWLDKE